ncbi:MAG: YibE/F family protein, partial [bacterium]|nr:YibE/F family protein [bacterium]
PSIGTDSATATASALAPNDGSDNPLLRITSPTFHLARVARIVSQQDSEIGGYPEVMQQVEAEITTGEVVIADYYLPLGASSDRLLKTGQQVVLLEQVLGDESSFIVSDLYRLPSVMMIVALFTFLLVIFAGWRGLTALLGLGVSIALLLYYVVPQIAAGAEPMTVSLIGSLLIAAVSLYLAHGWNRRTTISLLGTLITLALSVIAAVSFVSFAKLFGLGSEESLELQYGAISGINLKGLLLAGMIIGALGVLDDITTAQAAAVDEIYKANPKLSMSELYSRGMSVGREHITSLVNTLALAYAGASLPMLLLFTVYKQPLWVTVNSEFIVEEVIRTMVGSLALLLAVPITTWLAAYFIPRAKQIVKLDDAADLTDRKPHSHRH